MSTSMHIWTPTHVNAHACIHTYTHHVHAYKNDKIKCSKNNISLILLFREYIHVPKEFSPLANRTDLQFFLQAPASPLRTVHFIQPLAVPEPKPTTVSASTHPCSHPFQYQTWMSPWPSTEPRADWNLIYLALGNRPQKEEGGNSPKCPTWSHCWLCSEYVNGLRSGTPPLHKQLGTVWIRFWTPWPWTSLWADLDDLTSQ